MSCTWAITGQRRHAALLLLVCRRADPTAPWVARCTQLLQLSACTTLEQLDALLDTHLHLMDSR